MATELDETPCGECNLNRHESRKFLWIQCTVCRPGWFHVTCLGLTGATAEALKASRNWRCGRTCSASGQPSQDHPAQQCPENNLNFRAVGQRPVEPHYPGVKVVQRIPKGARHLAATKLAGILDRCTEENTAEAWSDLFNFKLCQPPAGDKNNPTNSSLTSKLKSQLNSLSPLINLPTSNSRKRTRKKQSGSSDDPEKLARFVQNKLAVGDIRGAVRSLSAETGLAPFSQETADLLKLKHPSVATDISQVPIPDLPADDETFLRTSEDDVAKAISSFPAGSSGGPDGLTPIHLKDLTSKSTGDAGLKLLSAISHFTDMILRGGVCQEALPIFFGAKLCALEKKGGGIRPIAVGNTLRRIAGKVISQGIQQEMGHYLRPVQLGYGTKAGCEAAIHSIRQYAQRAHNSPRVILKGDYYNAFNTIERTRILQKVAAVAPKALPYAVQAYANSSQLFFGDFRLTSACGVQQGDPLGPLLFSLGIHDLATSLSSELKVWYLDDVTICGEVPDVLRDLRRITTESKQLGLQLNADKSEITILGTSSDQEVSDIQAQFQDVAPGIRTVSVQDAELLGAPLHAEGIPGAIREKISALARLKNNLSHVGVHNSLFLLKNCFLLPKLLYILRTVPTWSCGEELDYFDKTQRDILENTLNVRITDEAWTQAALPVKDGGLGVRRASDLAIPAYFSSLAASATVARQILPGEEELDTTICEGAKAMWIRKSGSEETPEEPAKQQSWDKPIVKKTYQSLIERSDCIGTQARLKAATGTCSGAWLEATPIPSLGTRLEDEAVRIAISLRLGSNVVVPHTCRCSAAVRQDGLHGLDCQKSAGRYARHSELNTIIHRSLASIGRPSILEPNGMTRQDGRRPDGMTLFPWHGGKPLVWDVTCVSTLASSHLQLSVVEAGAAAAQAEEKKVVKYRDLQNAYHFTPLGFETMGHWGPATMKFVRELGKLLTQSTGEPRSTAFLKQRLSVAIQRGNAAAVRGTVPEGVGLSELFHLPFDN